MKFEYITKVPYLFLTRNLYVCVWGGGGGARAPSHPGPIGTPLDLLATLYCNTVFIWNSVLELSNNNCMLCRNSSLQRYLYFIIDIEIEVIYKSEYIIISRYYQEKDYPNFFVWHSVLGLSKYDHKLYTL